MSLLHDPSFMAHFAQCKVSAKQQVNSMIDAIYAKVLLDLELWLNKHESNHSVHGLGLNEPTGESMQFMLTNTQQIHENVNSPPSLPPSNFGPHSNGLIKSKIDSDCEENVTHHNNLPGQSQFDQSTEAENDHLTNTQDHNNLQNEVSLSNTINTVSMIKQELDDDDEGAEEIDENNVRKYENCENGICTSRDDAEKGENGDESSDKTQLNVHAASENNQTNQCFQSLSITSIPFDIANNAALNDIAIDEQIEGQNTQIQTDEFDDNDDDDYDEDGEEEYLNNPHCEDCANGDCDLDHENNKNPSDNNVTVRDGDQTDIETNFEEAQFDISVTNNTQMNNQNTEKCFSERNMEQSTPSTSGVRSSTRKQIQTKIFNDLVQSNGNPRNSAKRKSDEANENVKKVKRKQILDDYEDTDSDDQEDHAYNAIREKSIATECTTNPIQPNPAQSNRHLHCPQCTKSFDRNSKLQAHLRVHTGERPFQCDQCGKRFSRLGGLIQHQLIHQNMKRFHCEHCGKRFNHKAALNNHLLVHSGERPHQCRFCDKSFAQWITLSRHEQAIHLHVKPYRCKQCAHTATIRSHVIAHIRMVHFGLPKSIKQQRALNIVDERDPKELLEKV